MNRIVIGINGRKGHGKDTIGDHLVQHHGFVKRSFADALRREVADWYGIPVDLLLDRRIKETPLEVFSAPAPWELDDPAAPREPRSVRQITQHWGTEYRRKRSGESYWVDQLEQLILSEPEVERIVITDMRFPNELSFVATRLPVLGFTARTFRVVRPELLEHTDPTDLHASETALDGACFDEFFENREGELERLYREVNAVVSKLLAGVKASRQGPTAA